MAGIPDIFLPCARGRKHGFYVEMKTKGGSVTPIQKAVHERLRENDYMVCVCYDAETAIIATIAYLGMDK